MKILIFSDSHGELRWMEQAVFEETPDCIIHLGDKQRDAEKLQEMFCRIPMISVPGNCDPGSPEPKTVVRELNGFRILATHGHEYGVKGGTANLGYAAMEAGVHVALFGHTHIAAHEKLGDIHLFNPGAAGGSSPGYGVLELKKGQEITCRRVKF